MCTYYAAIGKEKRAIERSSSGGVFFVLAKQVIRENGVVCGAAFDKELKVKHIIVNSLSELKQLQGSKYVQSEMGDIFKNIVTLLKTRKIVLFSGTPCQVNGLCAFLENQKIQHENLITIEILCHGVPSPGIFFDYIRNLEFDLNTNIVEYQFRSKDLNKNFVIKVSDSKGKIKYINALTDPYYSAFLNSSILRPSCYECKFCGNRRKADITLGDFWGIEKAEVSNILKNGCSLVVCNSLKGMKFFEKSADELIVEKVDEQIAINRQSQLRCSKRMENIPQNRVRLFEKWKQEKSTVFFKYLKRISVDRKKVIFNSLPNWLIKLIKRVI